MTTPEHIETLKQTIEEKRQEVQRRYKIFGIGSEKYETSFNELSALNKLYMAMLYRQMHGLSDTAKTPYREE